MFAVALVKSDETSSPIAHRQYQIRCNCGDAGGLMDSWPSFYT